MAERKIDELIKTVYEALNYAKSNPSEKAYMLDGINEAVKAVFAGPETGGFPPPPTVRSVDDDFSELEEWLNAVAGKTAKSERKPLPVDIYFGDDFIRLFGRIKGMSEGGICAHILQKFDLLPDKYRKTLESYFNEYPFWGTLNIRGKDYGVFKNRAAQLYNRADGFVRLYKRLADYRSRFVLRAFVENWLNFDFDGLEKAKETVFSDYFDPDIMKCGFDEVLVDLGAYVGDTVQDYVRTYGRRYKKIYCYEISPKTVGKLKKNLEDYPDVEIRQKGVGEKKGVMYMKANPAHDSANVLSANAENASAEVEVAALDEDITEPVTFIKMDVEGAEQAAVRGCRKHIANDKPKLAISLYHNNEDITEIPRMVDEICPGYDFYLRYHGDGISPTELTLLAVYKR
ncbi:MAG: FkbM family methyltransferase [Oscillospiraceae bacterium]|jgi:FkbM family methyltransferase|nr:FkbM family methyltransferase [Oscillospiraceae bacterium]